MAFIRLHMMAKKLFVLLTILCFVSVGMYYNYWNWSMDPTEDQPCFLYPNRSLRAKHTNVVFLKTHKTASSTMQNILFRFAEHHNLTVAIPKSIDRFFYPSLFQRSSVHPHTLPPNIITNHMRFNKKELEKLMPPDSVYVTIMRETSSMFESSWDYFSAASEAIHRVPNKSLAVFLENPFKYYRPNEPQSMLARNCLTFDLGGNKDNTSIDYAQQLAAEVEKTFSLVMISNYFDESLILLRHLLNWDLEDIVYFKANMRSEKAKKTVTPELSAKIRSWNSIDAYLFDHFNASLWRQLNAVGLECVAREVKLLRKAQQKLMKTCFGEEAPRLKSASKITNKAFKPWLPGGVDILGYELAQNLTVDAQRLCTKLTMPELQYSNAMLQAQSKRYLKEHPEKQSKGSAT